MDLINKQGLINKDLISRSLAIYYLTTKANMPGSYGYISTKEIYDYLSELPSVEPEIIRCRDCKWWDKYSDTRGYCLVSKHGHLSKHWNISIKRTYDADWYCAGAERREGKQDGNK